MTSTLHTRGWRLCLGAAALFGASSPAASVLVDDVAPLILAGLLYLGAAVAVLPAVVRQRPSVTDLRLTWRPLAIAVLLGGAVGPALLVTGLSLTTAATASILLNTELVATVVLAALFFREHIGSRVAAGAALVTTAGVAASWQPGAEVDPGALLVVAGCVCWGVDNCVTAGIDRVSPETVVLCKGAVAGGANLALGILIYGAAGSASIAMVGSAVAVGALGYGLSIALWVRGAQALGAARAQMVFAVGPFFGTAIAWLVLRDPVMTHTVVAAGLAAVGIGLAVRSEHEHPHTHEPIRHRHGHTHSDAHHDHDHAGVKEVELTGSHEHEHAHDRRRHSHPHLPDLHHRHDHAD